MRRRRSRDDEQAIGCLIYFMLIVFFMPFVGVYLLCKPDPNAKLGGGVLLAIGLILWLWIALT